MIVAAAVLIVTPIVAFLVYLPAIGPAGMISFVLYGWIVFFIAYGVDLAVAIGQLLRPTGWLAQSTAWPRVQIAIWVKSIAAIAFAFFFADGWGEYSASSFTLILTRDDPASAWARAEELAHLSQQIAFSAFAVVAVCWLWLVIEFTVQARTRSRARAASLAPGGSGWERPAE